MEYGILKDGTMVISTNIKTVKNVKKQYKTQAEYVKAGGIIPFTMMDAKQQKEYLAKQGGI